VYSAGKACIIERGHGVAQDFFLEHDHAISCLSLHPDGSVIASGDEGGGCVCVWRVEGCELLSCVREPHEGGVAAVAVGGSGGGGREGGLVVSACRGGTGRLTVWEWGTGTKVASAYPQHFVNSIKFCPYKGHSFATSDSSGATLWSIDSAAGTMSQTDVSPLRTPSSCLEYMEVSA
jgi:WD40 repeat protein